MPYPMLLISAHNTAPTLLFAGNGFMFIAIIYGWIIVYALAPLFSLIFLLSKRGSCKWAAIIFTAMLFAIQLYFGDKILPTPAAVLPDFCLALVLTGLWRRIDNARYPWVSLVWATFTIRFVLAIYFFLLNNIVRSWPDAPALHTLIFIVPAAILTAVAGVIILKEMQRRQLRMPEVIQVVGAGIAVMVADSLISQGMFQLQLHFSDRFFEAGIPFNWAQLGKAAVAGAIGGVLAWVYFQNKYSRPQQQRETTTL